MVSFNKITEDHLLGHIGSYLPAKDACAFINARKSHRNEKVVFGALKGRDEEFNKALENRRFEIDELGLFVRPSVLNTIKKFAVFGQGELCDAKLRKIVEKCSQLEQVCIERCGVTREGLQSLQGARNLTSVALLNTTEVVPEIFADKHKLKRLYLNSDEMTFSGQFLEHLSALEELMIKGKSVDACLPFLKNKPSLQRLCLSKCSPELFERHVAPLNIKHLFLWESDGVVQHVATMKSIETLLLDFEGPVDLECFSQMTNVQKLFVTGQFRDEQLQAVCSMPNLRALYLGDSYCSRVALEMLPTRLEVLNFHDIYITHVADQRPFFVCKKAIFEFCGFEHLLKDCFYKGKRKVSPLTLRSFPGTFPTEVLGRIASFTQNPFKILRASKDLYLLKPPEEEPEGMIAEHVKAVIWAIRETFKILKARFSQSPE